MNKLILTLFLFFIFSYMFSPSPTPLPHTQNLSEFSIKCEKIGLKWISMPQIILLGSGLVSLFWFILLHLCNQVNFVTFNTNLTLFKKKSNPIFPKFWLYLLLVLLGLLLSEYPENFYIHFSQHFIPNLAFIINIDHNAYKCLARICFHVSCVFIFNNAISPSTHILSLFVFQILCHTQYCNVPRWLPLILILLANDIERNPGPTLQN